MGEAQLLERITLDRQAISFNRMYTTSVLYYHWHQCVELLYISSGYGIVVVDNQHYTARPGRLFIFPPFRLHKVQVDHSDKNPYHRTTMHIEQSVVESALSAFPRHQAQFAALAASNLPAQIYDLSEHAAFIERILEQFQRLESTGQTTASEVAFLVMQLMTFLPEQPQRYPPRQQTVASRIMNWIEAHYASKFSLDQLACDLGLSRSYTSRVFRQQTGGNIHEYLLTRRIKRSCDLLRNSDESIDAIALAVGFGEVTYFITCFKKMMRQTPLQYRKASQRRSAL
ncbi:TPA: helix-turn-helix transcriptional regulator [Klebsiella aerogenes]|uniref:helix-turn-helix domain-containing protein n=1 Tax=Klebsiella aerogenes TaxID=548 RepID=UPI000501DE58|nr:AraC family transcriptional regulator [Klebsiella aerogenes]EIV6643791.1 helix-turn-helix transcriptional regulator [Klebsiella aerogenes]EJC6253986.1 helix-turn-helix transcriptional regulator [Klebsiella aerogenes]EKT3981191.1 helix-turn-helix transcriptional regulator [Klebsiella aerogenes]EKU8180067.1 helix-turn-helix transcriptional regulator [Klebsiella aerogenes]EKW1037768.1 helix-turn-helix transcriptional regulator [Klebsiella aerogenes]